MSDVTGWSGDPDSINTFISSPSALMKDINRSNVIGRTSEFLTSYYWDFKIIQYPLGIAFPDEKDWRLKTTSIIAPNEPDPTMIGVSIRGFNRTQPGMINTSSMITLNVQDFQDVAFQNAMIHWVYSLSDPETHASWDSVANLRMHAVLFRLNSRMEPIKAWDMIDMLLLKPEIPDEMTSDKQPLGPSQFSFNIDHCVTYFKGDAKFTSLTNIT